MNTRRCARLLVARTDKVTCISGDPARLSGQHLSTMVTIQELEKCNTARRDVGHPGSSFGNFVCHGTPESGSFNASFKLFGDNQELEIQTKHWITSRYLTV